MNDCLNKKEKDEWIAKKLKLDELAMFCLLWTLHH